LFEQAVDHGSLAVVDVSDDDDVSDVVATHWNIQW